MGRACRVCSIVARAVVLPTFVVKAEGPFDVELKPLDGYAPAKHGMKSARMSIDKTFSGELTGTSRGEMLSVHAAAGSAAYVAMEQVTGELDGKKGSFVLVHLGTMTADASHLTLEVVPDSGTGELVGLSGSMEINNDNGKHTYVFDYQI